MDESSIKPEKRSRVRGRDHLILYELMPSGRAVSAGKAAHPVTTFVLLLFQEIYPIQARAFLFLLFLLLHDCAIQIITNRFF